MARKTLQELNLVDDFLFTSMLSYPGIGPVFIRAVLGIILNRDFGELSVTCQKVYPGIDTDKHGIRMDVYVEENVGVNGSTRIFDVEPDKNDTPEEIAALPRRTRFYRALIDVRSLDSGDDYTCLKDVTVIFITTYDPFGHGRMLYTVKTGCVEMPEMPFEDGAKTLYLYIGGSEGNPPEKLKELLAYLGDTRPENAVNSTLKELQKMVDTVKEDKGVSLRYMKIFEQEQKIREEGRKEERANTEREHQRAENAESRAKSAEIRAENAESRAESAEIRAEDAESRAEDAESRAEDAESRAENAESRLQLASKILGARRHHPEWTDQQLADACGCTLEELNSF